MAADLRVLVGTKKGVFILESDAARKSWSQRGPFLPGTPINHVIADPETGVIYAAGGNPWVGLASGVRRMKARHGRSPAMVSPMEGEPKLKSVWSLGAGKGVLYAGVEPAGLFRSTDGGQSWSHVKGLRDHPSRADWVPGGAGLILHSMVIDPEDQDRLWVAISTAGVFHSADGGDMGAAQYGHARRFRARNGKVP